jgi:hypothetical protein
MRYRPLTSTPISRPSVASHFDSVSNLNLHHKGSALATPISEAGPRYIAYVEIQSGICRHRMPASR